MHLFIWYIYSEDGCFLDTFANCNVRKSTVFFNPSISNQMSLSVTSLDNSGVAGGKQRGDLPLIKPQKGTRIFLLWFVIVELYNLGRSFVYASVSKFLGV